MKRTTILLATITLLYLGCKGKGGSTSDKNKNDSSHFFQTNIIFQKDIHEVEATPFYIYKLEKINDKIDSTQINTAAFKQLAVQFLKPDISTEELKPKYKESIFEDQTTASITINYTALDKELEVQSEDILMKDDGKTVRNIFIRKFFKYGSDSSAIEQLSWKPGERFQVVRSVQKQDNTETNYQTTVVWNEKAKD